jgi:hypothetical protein
VPADDVSVAGVAGVAAAAVARIASINRVVGRAARALERR